MVRDIDISHNIKKYNKNYWTSHNFRVLYGKYDTTIMVILCFPLGLKVLGVGVCKKNHTIELPIPEKIRKTKPQALYR